MWRRPCASSPSPPHPVEQTARLLVPVADRGDADAPVPAERGHQVAPVRGLLRLKLEADNVTVERGRRHDIIDDEDDLSQSAAETTSGVSSGPLAVVRVGLRRDRRELRLRNR